MSSQGSEAEHANEPAGRLGWRGWLLVFLLIVVSFACAAGYLSASLRLQRSEASAAQERARMQSEAAATRDALVRRAAGERSAEAKDLLQAAALSLSWAVRRAVDEKEHHEIGVYFRHFVAIPNVRRAALVVRGGEVKVASDKTLEGRAAADAFPNAPLDGDAPSVHESADRMLEAVVPIMSLNARLGTLIVDYQLPVRREVGYPAGP